MSFKIYKHHGTESIFNLEKIIMIDADPNNKEEFIIYLEDDLKVHIDKKDLLEIKERLGLIRPKGGLKTVN